MGLIENKPVFTFCFADEIQLYDKLVTKHISHKYIRPVDKPSDCVQVDISLALIGLEDLVCKLHYVIGSKMKYQPRYLNDSARNISRCHYIHQHGIQRPLQNAGKLFYCTVIKQIIGPAIALGLK